MGPLSYANTIKSEAYGVDRQVTYSVGCSSGVLQLKLRRVTTHTVNAPSRKLYACHNCHILSHDTKLSQLCSIS